VTNWKDALPEKYPGSSRSIEPMRRKGGPAPEPEAWDKPRVYTVAGKDVEFFTVGQLAMALNRQPVTIRKWEEHGVIPSAVFRIPSKSPNGKHRLYTRAQVEGIIRIAKEEGILYSHQKPIGKTRFTERVIELFAKLVPEERP
jgi:hypothetical protein